MWTLLLFLSIGFSTISLQACGETAALTEDASLGDIGMPTSPSPNPSPPKEEEEEPLPNPELSGLERFASAEELASFLTERSLADPPFVAFDDGVTRGGPVGEPGTAGPAAPAGAPEAAAADTDGSDGFSTTTIQEAGVDESDVVKNDGTHLFILDDSEVRIIQAQPAETIQQVSSIPIEGFGTALFLRDNMLIALSQTFGFFGIPEPLPIPIPFEEDVSAPPVQSELAPPPKASTLFAPSGEQKTIITVADVSNRFSPQIQRTITLDGSLFDSRLVDGTLHMVLQHFNVVFEAPVLIEQLPDILPEFVDTKSGAPDQSGLIVEPTEFYRPIEDPTAPVIPIFDQSFTTVATIDLDNPESSIQSLAVFASPGSLYSSREALYLASTFCGRCFGPSFQNQNTELHKIALSSAGPVYVASGFVPGYPLNQFSFSEHEGFLRVATTTQPGPSNHVFVVKESNGQLDIAGRIENIATTETIQSARFIGDRGFLVTFRRIDPLFTLDLSDPANPRVAGELKVPGFSTFMLPISENELLAVGQDADDEGRTLGMQLSIFDVSNFANPTLMHKVVIGDRGTHSEALHNARAFTYFADEQVVAFPIQETDATTGFTFIGLSVYRATAQAGFELLGNISTGTIDGLITFPRFTRGVFIDNDVYAATPDVVRAAPLADVGRAPWSAILSQPESTFDE